MSIQAIASVLEADIPEVAAKMLLVCIANAHNTGTGTCCPSIDRLAKESGMSRSSVKRWLKWLTSEGYLTVSETHDQHARQQTNSYTLHTTSSRSNLNPQPKVEPGEGFTSEPDEGSNCEPPLKEPEEYRKKEPEGARANLLEEFERYIWDEFPQNPGSNKAWAFDAYSKLSPEDRVACMRGVARLALRFEEAPTTEPMDRRLMYHPHLSKWIREQGWKVELVAA